jgi:hypothetical protein
MLKHVIIIIVVILIFAPITYSQDNDTVFVTGTVTVGTGVFYAGVGSTFYIHPANDDPAPGVLVYDADPDDIPILIPGDSISFYALLSYHTYPYEPPTDSVPQYLLIAGTFNLISSEYRLPEPITITAELIDSAGGGDSLATPYMGTYVRIDNIVIDSVVVYSSTSTWICHDSTAHRFWVREASDLIDHIPAQFDSFTYIQGVLCRRYGAYLIQPAYMRDIGFLDVPLISNAGHHPENPVAGDSITVSCTATDDGEIVAVELRFRINLGGWLAVAMNPVPVDQYYYTFSPMSSGTLVNYLIVAEDDEGNMVYWPGNDYMSFYVDEIIGVDQPTSLPYQTALYQNYPNPFNLTTKISYTIAEPGFVTLTVYDLLGRKIGILADNYAEPGEYKITFDASGLPSGFYFYNLQAGEHTDIRRMLLVK